MSEYGFPPFHSFPPSFTRQPIEETRAKQTELWCDLIRDYCRVKRIFWLDVSQARESSLFHNPAIDRRLSDEDIHYFLGQLVRKGDAVWDPDRKRCLVFWRRPSDWGELIYQWVENTGRNGNLLTVHEIRKGSASIGYEFHDLELDTTMKALQALEAIGKCIIIRGDGDDGLGVKFVN
ncbi:unnamed protein product [Agarophyton chilense]